MVVHLLLLKCSINCAKYVFHLHLLKSYMASERTSDDGFDTFKSRFLCADILAPFKILISFFFAEPFRCTLAMHISNQTNKPWLMPKRVAIKSCWPSCTVKIIVKFNFQVQLQNIPYLTGALRYPRCC